MNAKHKQKSKNVFIRPFAIWDFLISSNARILQDVIESAALWLIVCYQNKKVGYMFILFRFKSDNSFDMFLPKSKFGIS